ncbi:TetR family transcriptional regulator [Streptomyces sp. WMMC500]|uniref:TetR/AcrR family transcriptional regulator n=1 Tax=Streptomyces sp. WMMC500 TaxID=3015154 RepID=UPI00248C637B|nr:TetR family transcriptional regulator [Streptomyces sp. WMMC500]WBB60845.1 TetR family transcriptional regulator [Streptomyces sp. WMMC500]
MSDPNALPAAGPSTSAAPAASSASRQEVIADAAIALLAERGMRGLTHRAVDEAAGLPQGSTSNRARTRAALLELTIQRLAEREGRVLGIGDLPLSGTDPGPLADALAGLLHRFLTRHRTLLVARYELALEATRRPELRAIYDRAGATFGDAAHGLLAAWGSADPERHAQDLIAWTDGMMFLHTAGRVRGSRTPSRARLRAGYEDLLRGMLGG